MKRIFVTGIGTEVGKTVVAAIITEALGADYWKPIQSGCTDTTDTETVKSLVTNTQSVFHPETYKLPLPLSPHAAAQAAGITIHLEKIKLPETRNNLVIEGAGGLLVPINNQNLLIDLITQLKAEVILVSKNYLGSINHTLLSWEALQQRHIKVLGLIFNGEPNPQTESFILNYTGLTHLLSVLPALTLTPAVISDYATQLRQKLDALP